MRNEPQSTTRTRSRGDDAVVLRPAHLRDAESLIRLAELDSAAPLDGDVLLAERDGRIVAARELRSGRIIADPFRPTADLLALLEARAALLHGAAIRRRGPGVRRLLSRPAAG